MFEDQRWGTDLTSNTWTVGETETSMPRDHLNEFYRNMSKGYSFLEVGKMSSAFETFDRSFSLVYRLLREQNPQFLSYLCDLMVGFPSHLYQTIFSRLLSFLAEMASEVLSASHPIALVAGLLRDMPSTRATAAECILRCMLHQMQTRAGACYTDSVGVLQTFAWALLYQGQHSEALYQFEQLLACQHIITGCLSYETYQALRGIARLTYVWETSTGPQSCSKRSRPTGLLK